MAVVETIGGQGTEDYSSASAWEAGIPADPTEPYTGQIIDSPFNAGQVEINVSNTNGQRIWLTVATDHRYDKQTDWPNIDAVRDQCAHISASTGNGSVIVNTNDVRVSGLAIIRTGANDCIRVEGANRDNLEFYDLLLIGATNQTTRRGFDRVGNATPGNEMLLYNIVVTSVRELYVMAAQDAKVMNCTALMQNIEVQDRYGFYGVYAINSGRAPTIESTNVISMGSNNMARDYLADGPATHTLKSCVSEDNTGSSSPTDLRNESRVRLMRNPWLGELEVAVPDDAKGQQWCDDVFVGYSFEGNRLHEAFGGNQTGYSIGTAAALHGKYGLICELGDNFRDLFTPRFLADFGIDYWYGLMFRLDTGATIGTGNSFRFFDGVDSGTSRSWHEMRENGGNIQVRVQDRILLNAGTWQTITKGTTYKLMVRIRHDTLAGGGTFQWWLRAVGTPGWGSPIDTWVGTYNVTSQINELRFLGNAGTGSSGQLHIDYLFGSSTANVDVEGTSFGLGSSREGDTTYHGSDESAIFTTDYEGDTRSDWQIGPDEIAAAGPTFQAAWARNANTIVGPGGF